MEFNIKTKVKEYYGNKAASVDSKVCECEVNSSCCSKESKITRIYQDNDLADIPEKALQASAGCANPLLFAELKEGEVVLDLGSGGGIDVLQASKYVGESGKVYGLDMTDEMLLLAEKNRQNMGAANVEFLKGYIEDIPLENKTVDVVMSNCVINLSEDKEKALSEAYRVIKDGGRLSIADIVTLKEIPSEFRKKAEFWCGCFAGTLMVDEYRYILEKVGFKEVDIIPVHHYSRETFEKILVKKSCCCQTGIEKELDEVKDAFAGALIKARK